MSKFVVAAMAMAVAGFFATPSFADCAKDTADVKAMAVKATDAKKKDMAMKHVMAAEGHVKAKAEDKCMSEVKMAKDALK
jgi:hypothetical protein